MDYLFTDEVKMSEDELPSEWLPDLIKNFSYNRQQQLTHLIEVIQKVHTQQKDGTFCDIKLVVGGKVFPAHKTVLASCSDFFMAMFSSGFKESRQAEASIAGKPEAFEVLLECAYSGKLSVTMANVMDVLEMAHYLQFSYAIRGCTSFLTEEVLHQNVDITGAIRIMSTADVYGLEKLKKGCMQYIAENLAISDGFVQLMTAELMMEILKRTDLAIDEKQVFMNRIRLIK